MRTGWSRAIMTMTGSATSLYKARRPESGIGSSARIIQFRRTSGSVPGDEPIARDYDGDGKTDMAVVRRTGGNMIWYLFFSSTNSFTSRTVRTCNRFYGAGDYDGKFDFAVQRPGASPTSPATFYIQTTTAFEGIQFGQSKDLVVPGDYDGDGKTDLAVVREGAADRQPELVLQGQYDRTDGWAVSWGVTGTDLLAQNDYTGDGKTDLGIWRNSVGRFYVFNPEWRYYSRQLGTAERLPDRELRYALILMDLVMKPLPFEAAAFSTIAICNNLIRFR